MKKPLLLLLLLLALLLAACGPKSDPVPWPTDLPPSPYPTLEPLPTLVPLPTYTPFPSPTDIPEPTATDTPSVPTSTPEPISFWVRANKKFPVREVCNNVNGFLFNNKGWPIIFDCVYSDDGTVGGRIIYNSGEPIEVLIDAGSYFNRVYKTDGVFRQTQNDGNKIKSDGNQNYYITVDGYFIPSWFVSLVK